MSESVVVNFDNKIKVRPIDPIATKKVDPYGIDDDISQVTSRDILQSAPLFPNMTTSNNKNNNNGRRNKFRGDRKPRFEPVAVLLEAAERGDLEEVQAVLTRSKVPLNSCNTTGLTALHYAVANGHYPIVHLLLDAGAQVNLADDQGWTPLMMAVANDDRRISKLLLHVGADLEAYNGEGQQAMDVAGSRTLPLLEQVRYSKYHNPEVMALYEFNPNQEMGTELIGDELAFQQGDLLFVLNRKDENWWLAEDSYGRRGFIPKTHIQ